MGLESGGRDMGIIQDDERTQRLRLYLAALHGVQVH